MDFRMLNARFLVKVIWLLGCFCLFAAAQDFTTADPSCDTNTERGDLANEAADPPQSEPEHHPEPEAEHTTEPRICYVCSSEDENGGDVCNDPVDESELGRLPTKECNATANQFSCYKVVTSHKKVGADEADRIVITTRLCASWDGGESSWSSDAGSDRWATRSYCNSDLCNAGHVTFASLVTWVGGLLTVGVALMLS